MVAAAVVVKPEWAEGGRIRIIWMALSGSVGVRVTVTHADSFFGFDGHVVGLG